MKTLYVKSAKQWRSWLEKNYDKKTEIWFVYYKKGTSQPTVSYGDSVEEALCFGWIDGIIKKIDEEKYVRRFTPRKDNSIWSEPNKKRVAKLIKDGRMTEIGMRLVKVAKKNGKWDEVYPTDAVYEMPPEFKKALSQNKKAQGVFENLTPLQQREYIQWIVVAKREETKVRRIEKAITMLSAGLKRGMV